MQYQPSTLSSQVYTPPNNNYTPNYSSIHTAIPNNNSSNDKNNNMGGSN
jgi:hypothetical protein